MNYVLPTVSTDRGKGSIKFSGPKAWAEVPNHLKEIAFRKPFAKKLKEHILSSTYQEMAPVKTSLLDRDDIARIELTELFQSDEEENEFIGFENPGIELNKLFLSDSDENDDFLGFNTPKNDLQEIFLTDSETGEFFGF